MIKAAHKANLDAGKATRDHILEVTLAFIQQEGLTSLTVRTIAERAGVNVAAVNYHFGSKEALISEVMLSLTTDLREAFTHLNDSRTAPAKRLHRFLDALSLALLQHADIYRQAIGLGFMSGDAKQQYLHFLRAEGFLALRETVQKALGTPIDELRLTLRIMQAIGGLAHPLLVSTFLEDVANLRFADEAVRKEHVRVCLEMLLRPEK